MTDGKVSDVLVIGGGSAGSVLAGRLSDDSSLRVILLEAGGDDDDPDLSDIRSWPALLGGRHDWKYRTVAQAGLNGRELNYPRGKVLGGSSSINASGFQWGDVKLFKQWEAAAGKEWGAEEIAACLSKIESVGAAGGGRGTAGPITVSKPEVGGGHPVASAFITAAEAHGFARLEDINSPDSMVGAGWGQVAAQGNLRISASWGYLAAQRDRPNLEIVFDAHVVRLIFENERCVGALCVVGGESREYRADQIILAAGAVGSPLILQRSGVGDAELVAGLGVKTRVHAPEVGKNLQDHPIARVLFSANMRTLRASTYAPAVLFACSSAPVAGEEGLSDIAMLCGGRMFPDPSNAPAFAISVALTLPHSRGTVRASGAGPFDAPLIDPAYLSDDRDAARMAEAIQLAEDITQLEPLRKWLGNVANREKGANIAEFTRAATGPFFHPVGSCRMGEDEASVVDPQLRVRGVDGLYLADASIMPRIPNAMPNAAILALAENAARLIRKQF